MENGELKGKIVHKFVLLLLFLIITGCAAKSGVIQIDTDTFMVSRKAATVFYNFEDLKSDALQEAAEYCKSQNKHDRIVNTKESPPAYFLGKFPKVEVQFMCVNKKEADSPGP